MKTLLISVLKSRENVFLLLFEFFSYLEALYQVITFTPTYLVCVHTSWLYIYFYSIFVNRNNAVEKDLNKNQCKIRLGN